MTAVPDDLAVLICDVRHDVNNALMAIYGYLDLVLKDDRLPAELARKLKQVEAESRRIHDCLARTSFITRPGS